MDVLRSNLAQPNESITKGVPKKFVKIDFVLKAFGDVGRATLKSKNITATFFGGETIWHRVVHGSNQRLILKHKE